MTRTAARLDVTPEDDGRRWARHGGSELFRSEIWANGARSDYAEEGPYGERLLIASSALPSVLQRLGRDLLLEVEINHDVDRGRYSELDSAGRMTSARPYFHYYLFRQDGSVETVS